MTTYYRSEAAMASAHEAYRDLLRQWPIAYETHEVGTAVGDTFVIECGRKDAPTVVLMHGSMGISLYWVREATALAPHFRVLMIDLIGEPGQSAQVRPDLASDDHARWLDEVLYGLGVERAWLVGISFGGWLALDFAIRRPERVAGLALVVPGGVGKQKNILWWALPLALCGPWGRRRVSEAILGPAPAAADENEARFKNLMSLIGATFRPRRERLPVFTDAQLAGIRVPVLAVVAGRDVLLDPVSMRDRLTANVADLELYWLPEARHFPGEQSTRIREFLLRRSAEDDA